MIIHKSNKYGLLINKIGRTVYLYKSKDMFNWIQSGILDSEESMNLFKWQYNEIVNEHNELNKKPVIVDNENPILEGD